MGMSSTVLHFANLRLGSAFTAFGLRGRDLRARLLDTLGMLADLAMSEGARVVLISGDLFGCTLPAPATMAAVQAFFTRLHDAGIAVVVLPGGRDPAGIFDGLHQPDGVEHLPGALLLGPEHPIIRVSPGDLEIYYFGLPTGQAEGLISHAPVVRSPSRTALALAYWSGKGEPDLAAFAQAAATMGLQYLGIGGPSAFTVHVESTCAACTPGVPEPLDWGQAEGTAALLRIDQGVVTVEKRQVSKHRFLRRKVELSAENRGDAAAMIREMTDPSLGLEVVLTGMCPAEVLIDPRSLEAELADGFFSLRVVDRTGLMIDTSGLGDLPQGTVLGNFARLMDGRIRAAPDEEEAELYREAYRIAINLLQGGQSIQ